MQEMVDKHDLNSLEQEYIEIYVADLTDDVDCSPSTTIRRQARLAEIEDLVGKFIVSPWSRKAEGFAKKIGFASGQPWDE